MIDEIYFWHVDEHRNFLQVVTIILGVHCQACPSTQSKKFAYLCNISTKTWGIKLTFHLHINLKVFYKLIVSRCVCVARDAQSTQNNKFSRSLQYVKENVKDEVDFLPADKHRFLQIDTIILVVCDQAYPNYPK